MINDLPLIFSFLILVDWINKYWWTLTMYFLFSIHKSWEVSNSFLLEHFTTSFSYESFSTNSKASMILRRSEDVRIRYLVALFIDSKNDTGEYIFHMAEYSFERFTLFVCFIRAWVTVRERNTRRNKCSIISVSLLLLLLLLPSLLVLRLTLDHTPSRTRARHACLAYFFLKFLQINRFVWNRVEETSRSNWKLGRRVQVSNRGGIFA